MPGSHRDLFVTTQPWNLKRHYLGLTQTCQVMRGEFGPLYFDTLRYTMHLVDFHHFIDTFKLLEIDSEVRETLSALRQERLPNDGVDILPLVKVMNSVSEKITFFHERASGMDHVDLASHISLYWSPQFDQPDRWELKTHHREFTGRTEPVRNDITSVVVFSRPLPSKHCNTEKGFETVVVVTTKPDPDEWHNSLKVGVVYESFEVGSNFRKSLRSEVTTEVRSGTHKYVSTIKRPMGT
jgi:hypothetical protein